MVLCHNLCVLVQSMYELGVEPDFEKSNDEQLFYPPMEKHHE